MKRINEILPYGTRFMIQKIECRNHLLRNYISKLKILTTKTEYPVAIRKFITTNILRFRSDVTKAVTYQKNLTNKSVSQKISGTNVKYFCIFCIFTSILGITIIGKGIWY